MTISIYTDGSARQKDTTWVGAYAYAIYETNKAVYQFSQNVIPATVNVAELLAVIHAIHHGIKKYPNDKILIITDSMYVINGSKHPQKMKTNKNIWELYSKVARNTNIELKYVKAHDKDSKNKHVDALAKAKLRSQF